MARNTANSMKATKPVADVIELSSDSEPEAVEAKPQQTPAPEKMPQEKPDSTDGYVQPLLKVIGIKYKTNKTEEKPQESATSTPSSSKMTLRTRGTGSVKHKHVSIEIPLPSSMLRKKAGGEEESGHESGNEVFNTPMERKHITFNDSDQEDFVTPSEAPKRNPLELQINGDAAKEEAAKEIKDSEDEEDEDSDDEAPEAVSTRAAEAQSIKAAEAAANAIEEKEAADKRKRQERDARLKQQAKERKQVKRPVAEADSDSELEEPTPAPAEKRKREALPKLLPLEFLESDDEGDMSPENDSANSKRRKLDGVDPKLLREPKLPRDKRVGTTVYRVAVSRGNEKLAPKAKKQSMNAKQALLIRGRTAKKATNFHRR